MQQCLCQPRHQGATSEEFIEGPTHFKHFGILTLSLNQLLRMSSSDLAVYSRKMAKMLRMCIIVR